MPLPEFILPSVIAFHYNRGLTSRDRGRYDEALAHFDKAIALNPKYAEAYNHRGIILRELRRYDEALASVGKAIEIKPDYAKAYHYRGIIFMDKGDMKEAEKMFTEALQLQPDFANAWLDLTNIRKYKDANHPDIARIQSLLDDDATPPSDRDFLNFALGKAYNDCGLYDKAFEFYRQANEIRNSRMPAPYNPAATSAMADRIIAVFNRDFIAKPFLPDNPLSPVFIIGMPRSGTTLMAQILSNHPAIASAGELPTISEFALNLPKLVKKRVAYPEAAKYITPALASRLASDYEKRLRRDAAPNARFVVDKHPLNFRHLGFISMLFPKAHIIHCMRHPLDAALSTYFQRFSLDLDYAFDLQNIAHFYKQYAKLMAHWRQALPVPMLEIGYENMVADTEKATRKMLEFIGLEWDERCLSPHTNPHFVETASSWQVRQPIYRQSSGRWQRYEKHLGPLKEQLTDYIRAYPAAPGNES